MPVKKQPEDPNKVDIDKELQDALKEIVKDCEREDEEIFKAMARNWRKAEEFWHGCQYLFWDQINEAWRSPEAFEFTDDFETENQVGSFSDKVVDIYKAHGESIISALASQIPALRFLPDDADSTVDTITSRTYNKIADVIQRHNKAKLLALKALFYLANQGIVAAYRYKDSDFAYGSYKIPVYGSQKVESLTYTCPNCEYQTENPAEFESGCPQCGEVEKPEENKGITEVPIQVGVEDKPKTRTLIDIFGPLHFKVSYYARSQKECSYLGLRMDQGKDIVCDLYPDLYDEIQADRLESNERFYRSAFVYPTDQEVDHKNIITVIRWWLRPAAFNRETRKDKREKLQKKFPDGCKVVFLGKEKHFAEVVIEKLDDKWEIGQAGLSTYIYSDAILKSLIQIQEMRNQLINLILETIEHGIPSEFADPQVVNFDTFNRFEAVPGFIYKTKPGRPGDPIGNSFYTSQRATLSREVALFLKQLDQDAQFSTGSFPSIYGGPSEGKSRTFAEYAASRQMALQRLSIVWNLYTDWWLRLISGSVNMYVENVIEDEHYTKFEDGNFVNVWIKRSEMQGKVGGVEPEASESFPMSLAQKKDLILKLMELNNQYINNALYKPENARLIQDILALTEFKLPGESQRVKQVIEINDMLKDGATPIDTGMPDMTGQPVMQSTVPIDPNVDDDAVHIETLISFMVDLPGLDVARDNPAGYANLTAHLKAHQQNLALKTMTMAGGTPPGQEPETAHAGVEGEG
jgi:hypothetical protein